MALFASASCASLRKTSLLNTPRCVSVNVFHRVAFLIQVSAALTMPAKLQALVYDILPSTAAVFSYAIGSRKLLANEQFFCWCSNSSRFFANNSDKTRRVIYSGQQSLHQHK